MQRIGILFWKCTGRVPWLDELGSDGMRCCRAAYQRRLHSGCGGRQHEQQEHDSQKAVPQQAFPLSSGQELLRGTDVVACTTMSGLYSSGCSWHDPLSRASSGEATEIRSSDERCRRHVLSRCMHEASASLLRPGTRLPSPDS